MRGVTEGCECHSGLWQVWMHHSTSRLLSQVRVRAGLGWGLEVGVGVGDGERRAR